jgi:hypothetical protein
MVRCQWDRVHFLSSLTLGSRPVRPPTPLGLAALKSVKSLLVALLHEPNGLERDHRGAGDIGVDLAHLGHERLSADAVPDVHPRMDLHEEAPVLADELVAQFVRDILELHPSRPEVALQGVEAPHEVTMELELEVVECGFGGLAIGAGQLREQRVDALADPQDVVAALTLGRLVRGDVESPLHPPEGLDQRIDVDGLRPANPHRRHDRGEILDDLLFIALV